MNEPSPTYTTTVQYELSTAEARIVEWIRRGAGNGRDWVGTIRFVNGPDMYQMADHDILCHVRQILTLNKTLGVYTWFQDLRFEILCTSNTPRQCVGIFPGKQRCAGHKLKETTFERKLDFSAVEVCRQQRKP